MTPIDAVLLFALLFLPLNWLVLRHFDQLGDPAYLRRHGVVIHSQLAIEARGAAIGQYRGHPIAATVTFKGMLYRFDRIQEREALRAGELFLRPGLVYILA